MLWSNLPEIPVRIIHAVVAEYLAFRFDFPESYQNIQRRFIPRTFNQLLAQVISSY